MFDTNHGNPFIANQTLNNSFLTPTFAEIWETAEQFTNDYQVSGIYDADNTISNDKLSLLFYLLYAKYGNNPIAAFDITRFKYHLYSIIFMYGPAWEARLRIQKEYRDLIGSDELLKGSTVINNHAYNPSAPPSMDAFDPLTHINDQSANRRVKPKIEAYGALAAVIKTDVTAEFLDRFKQLFLTVVEPVGQTWYVTTPEEQEILSL